MAFLLGVSKETARGFDRLRVEDRLLTEAKALMAHENLDWPAHGFVHSPEFDVWEKTLTADEFKMLMRD